MSAFKEVLTQIRRESRDSKELGDRFERLVVQYLREDRQYRWKDAKLWPKKDYGIDIIAHDNTGERWAIQCKCHKDDAMLEYGGNITNLWPAADAEKIRNKMIVTTATPSANLDRQCRMTGTRIVRYADLESSPIEWSADSRQIRAREPHKLYGHQKEALRDCLAGFGKHDRGQLIMACGTGKTITALHIAEKQVGTGGLALYLVPSISLVKQTMQEWAWNANVRHRYIAVCSDGTVRDREDISVTDLAGPVTTDPAILQKQYRIAPDDAMLVIFSTYQSAEVVQRALAGRKVDLIIFDEAHRTTGGKGKSFALAHDDANISAEKRLYMTATPRIYKRAGVTEGYSMDNVDVFGPVFHHLRFSKAIREGILSDYKVVGLKVLAEDLDKARADADENAEFTLEEECKMASIYGAIQQQEEDREPNLLRRVLVFHNKISQSKRFEMAFPKIVKRVNEGNGPAMEVRHVDGKSRARDRSGTISWLKGGSVTGAATDRADSMATGPDVRVVSNVRCFSEGVDVPALDGVVFFEPRQSVVDVIQAVGRVMRRAPGKSEGYVIVPVVVSRNEAIQKVIDRDKSNKLILQIAEALRAHDDRIDRFFNQAALHVNMGKSAKPTPNPPTPPPQIREVFDVLPATLLDTGFYWDEYGRKLGEKAAMVALQAKNRSETTYRAAISALHNNLRDVVGDTVTRSDAVSAVAQHLVLRPVFQTLFGRSENPVWRAFDHVVDRLDFHAELEELEDWHKIMKYHVENISSPQAKQTVISKIYGNFFNGFDKRQAKTIVYTPVEIVDFIIHSVQHVLRTQFGTGFDGAVQVLDPFAGTGIFLARLMESGHLGRRLDEADLSFGENKLLAYYTACANLETAQEELSGNRTPFDGGSYVDTFTIPPDWRSLKMDGRAHEQAEITDPLFQRMRDVRDRQRDAHVHVIMGNPPYSGGQKTANDDNQNTAHPELEAKITKTYVDRIPDAIYQKRAVKNEYVKALRWASERIGESGIIGFIMPSAWITGNAEAGIRACLYEEFTDVYCFDLLGQKGISGHGRNVFEYRGTSEGGTTVATSIVILVKNPAKEKHEIHYASLSKNEYEGEQKRGKVKELKDISRVEWRTITPDSYHDWLNQRGKMSPEWNGMMTMGSKDGKRGKSDSVLFKHYLPGLGTGRDAWVYNSSAIELTKNMKRHIDYCNSQDPNNFNKNPKYAAWNPYLANELRKLNAECKQPKLNISNIRMSLYRPFFKQRLYYDKTFVQVHHVANHFPNNVKNMAILVPDKTKGDFSSIITDTAPERQVITNEQCFPFKTRKQMRENVRPVGLQTPDSRLQTPDSRLQRRIWR